MTLDLKQTLAWKKSLQALTPANAAELAMLNDLQGNILKGHGRPHTSNIFLTFDKDKSAQARKFLASIGHDVTTALDQLTEAVAFKENKIDAGTFMTVLISAEGYDALGCLAARPTDKAFIEGMDKRQLNDPPQAEWAEHFVGLHAMIIVAASDAGWRDAEKQSVLARVAATHGAVRCRGTLEGDKLKNKEGLGIEHFGYIDGRSQPLALQEDVAAEPKANPPNFIWDPAIFLDQLLVKCPGGKLKVSMGSYFVIRQLEQNVKGFKDKEMELGKALEAERQNKGLGNSPVGGRAGASVVGRFENGTPVTQSSTESSPNPARDLDPHNDFDYSHDKAGLKCPYAAHIRKSNPRSDTGDSKTHLMARRGITYGSRTDDIEEENTDDKPSGGVGLIFMAYQADLEKQFEFTQKSWVNNRHFAQPLVIAGQETGIDPVIGQYPKPPDNPLPPGQLYPLEWNKELSDRPFNFFGFVRMLGGEYLFAPSISFLKTLKQGAVADPAGVGNAAP